MKKNEIKQLTDVQHILQRSGIYLGSIQPVEQKGYFYNEVENKFEYKDFTYVPAFCKIINEIIDNALDEAIRTNFKHANEIHVTVTKDTIKVSDNGRGVPCDIDSTGKVSQLELAFCNARAGSNFDDSGRNTIGMNGVGSFCTNCFSTLFKVNSVTKTAKGVLTCKDNLSSKRCSITPGKFTNKETGTTVEFMPDLKRFGLKTIDDNHMNLIYQRMLFLSISYPEVTFKYNKKTIKFKNAKNFLNAFSDKYAVISDEKYMIGVLPNSYDDFVSKSFVNGADCINGGNHIDYIHSEVVGRLKEKLEKKYPNIKHGDIKNKLTYVVTFRDFENAQFDSQTKEKLANNVNDIKKFLDNVDWDKFVANIYKVDAILDPIIESFKIKEELKNRQALTKMGKTTKTFKCEKFLPSTKHNTYFTIVEGDSAKAGLMEELGRTEFGYFATRGVPLNTYEVSVSKITENKELENIVKCLNLRLGSDKQNMTYDNILLAADQDSDGSHIKELYIAFFYKYASSLIKEGKVKMLKTPIICLKDNKGDIKEMFFTFDEYNDYINAHENIKLHTHYYKGLGSWKKNELKTLILKHGLNMFIDTFEYDKNTAAIIDDWCSKKTADKRKEYLKENEFSIFSI